MANALYRRLPSGDWMNQGNPGGPSYFVVRQSAQDSLYYPYFTYNGTDYLQFTGTNNSDPVIVQQALDVYIGKLNSGTA